MVRDHAYQLREFSICASVSTVLFPLNTRSFTHLFVHITQINILRFVLTLLLTQYSTLPDITKQLYKVAGKSLKAFQLRVGIKICALLKLTKLV